MIKQNKQRLWFIAILFAGSLITWFRFGSGAGGNWDGIFPYWGDQIPSWVNSLFSSWNQTGTGSPITYTTGTLFTLIYYPLYLLLRSPELILFITVAALLSGAAFGVFMLIERLNSKLPFWLIASLSILSVVNPAIFYKLLAGHLYYLVGYLGFIYLILVLFSQVSWNKRSTILLGLTIALSASQIQFFVFSLLAIVIWWLFNRERVHYKYLVGAFGLALIIHSYWISGFIFGIHNISGLSEWASQNSFGGLSTALYQNILRLNFSDGTFISRFFGGIISLVGLAIVALLPFKLIGLRRASTTTLYFLTLFIVFTFLSTGAFHQFKLPVLELFFPVLREVGHVAPLVVLSLLLAISTISLPAKSVAKTILPAISLIAIVVNLTIYWLYVPRINFSQARNEFSSFNSANKEDLSTHRLLTYPFFNQFRLVNQDQTVKGGTPMSNTGWDSFTIFSGKEYIDNAVQAEPSIFQKSVQYGFVTTYDTKILKPYNVKYIYDYSKIYESYFEDFSARAVFGGDISVVQNDPNFTAKVLEKNPNTIQVSPGVIRLKDVLPRVFTAGSTFTKITPTEYRVTIPNSTVGELNFLSSFHPGWKLIREESIQAVNCDNPIIYENGSRECVGNPRAISGNEWNLYSKNGVSSERSVEFNYSNAWKIGSQEESKNGQTTYTIFFEHQARYLLFMLLSLATILACLSYLLATKKSLAA